MNYRIKKITLFPFNILYWIFPELELRLLYRLKVGSKLNLKNPKTYLEKLNWLKLNYRNELMPICSDKYHARKYIEDKGFGKYLTKVLWEGFNPEEIPFDELPDSFIIKCTSGSGFNIICKNKNGLNRKKTIKCLRKWLKEKYLPCYGEWQYNKIKPRVIIEELLTDNKNIVPIDYKMFCFNGLNNGEVGCIAVDVGRYVDHKRNIYDKDWNFLKDVKFDFQNDLDIKITRPKCFEEMKKVAYELAKPFPHVRADFFVIGENFYIGELTFFNGSGFDRITPHDFDVELGSLLTLPK